ncbi:hypothetical protein [Mucilaginibacter paludis]|nr:hypothetical protein [Mucilaginibacter paludis]
MQTKKNIVKISSMFSVITLSVFIMSCSGQSANNRSVVVKDTAPKAKVKQYPHHDEGDDGPTPSISSILDDVRKSYKDTVKVDTTFLINRDNKMTVKLRHYCTYDNKINLPARYLKIYNLSKFQTHDFISALEVTINSRVVFKGLIKKEDFEKLLDDELKKYAVLMSPNVKLSNNILSIQYSLSVPLSDVGKVFTMKIDTSGNKHITAD